MDIERGRDSSFGFQTSFNNAVGNVEIKISARKSTSMVNLSGIDEGCPAVDSCQVSEESGASGMALVTNRSRRDDGGHRSGLGTDVGASRGGLALAGGRQRWRHGGIGLGTSQGDFGMMDIRANRYKRLSRSTGDLFEDKYKRIVKRFCRSRGIQCNDVLDTSKFYTILEAIAKNNSTVFGYLKEPGTLKKPDLLQAIKEATKGMAFELKNTSRQLRMSDLTTQITKNTMQQYIMILGRIIEKYFPTT